MDVKSYKVFNPRAIMKFNLSERLHEALETTDAILGHVRSLDSSFYRGYVDRVKLRFTESIDNYTIHSNVYSHQKSRDLEYLNSSPELHRFVVCFVSKELGLKTDHNPQEQDIETYSLNHVKALERLTYHLAKSVGDLLGDEKGIPFWKRVVAKRLEAQRIDYDKKDNEREARGDPVPTMSEGRERSIKRWSELGLGDFTVAVFDEGKALYRFDRCLTHEALKDLDDADWAYLCSCYIGDAPEYNTFGRQYLRRTQTLHHGDFCDELYWLVDVHTNPEQPSLEFTRKLGDAD